MKPFDLQEYLKNPSAKIITRDGREAKIINTNMQGDYPILALVIDGQDKIGYYYKINGRKRIYKDSPQDLFFVPTRKEGWTNLYKGEGNLKCGVVFQSKEAAEKSGKNNNLYIATVRIEWEE